MECKIPNKKFNRQKQVDKNLSPNYEPFDQINGQHPWQEVLPEGYLNYNVRILPHGSVTYFNFDLAKEMGLISATHPNKLTNKLKKIILNTFNLRIINEYDLEKGRTYDESSVKPYPFMATRYLQLQHKNKKGQTSGDGRGIWNGFFVNKKQVWDISSRGTGVTALAPGSVEANKFLESGSTDFSYGCGLAEIDELFSSAIMSEILYNNGYNTERTLAIIEHKGGTGIGVRAGKNLFRPAHIFLYLKQGDYNALKKATDFILQRQHQNKEWDIPLNSSYKYNKMLDAIIHDFAQFTAYLERDYIFTWLDWDGDNVLTNAGIIDYGSIRQFGIRHDQYRYEDVDRYSTNLNEQKNKAQKIIQTFAQIVDFLNSKKKKPFHELNNHPAIFKFNRAYDHYLMDRFLFQLGIKDKIRTYLLQRKKPFIRELYNSFLKLEKTKTKVKSMNLEDGINKPAIFNMRKLLLFLSDNFISLGKNLLDAQPEELFNHLLVSDHHIKDAEFTCTTKANIINFINNFDRLLKYIKKSEDISMDFKSIGKNITIVNDQHRVTGNALIFIVDEVLKKKRSGLATPEIQKIIDSLIAQQHTNPEMKKLVDSDIKISNKSKELMKTVFSILEEYSEDI